MNVKGLFKHAVVCMWIIRAPTYKGYIPYTARVIAQAAYRRALPRNSQGGTFTFWWQMCRFRLDCSLVELMSLAIAATGLFMTLHKVGSLKNL